MLLYCKTLKEILKDVHLLEKVLEYALRGEFPNFRVSEIQEDFVYAKPK